jgi:hypothetical protein
LKTSKACKIDYGYSELSSKQDIGMKIRHTNHVNTSILQLHSLVENDYQAYHRIYHEDFASQVDPRSSKRSP